VRSLPRRIVVIVLFGVYAAPVLWLVFTSLKTGADVAADPAGFVFTPHLTAYVDAFHEGIGRAAVSTFVIAGSTAAICLLLALPTAFGLASSRTPLVPVALAVLILLQMIPQTSTLIPLYQVLGRWNLLGGYPGLILCDAALLLPFSIVLLLPSFRAISRDLYEAASMDGASTLTRFLRIGLPSVRGATVTVGTLVFILGSGEFLYAISFLSDPSQYPLTATISQQIATYGIDWPGLMAVSVLASLPALVIFVAGQRSLVRGLTLGAAK
jgi:multiple sugar transport system permease protein